jgi:flagellar biosynthesis protein FliQ
VASARVIVDQVLSGLDEALLITCTVAVVVLVVGLMAAILTSRDNRANRSDVASPSA